MKTLFILNSDYGIGHSIGARAAHIGEEIRNKKDLIIICRNYNRCYEKLNIIKIFPKAEIFMKILTGLQVYVSDKLPTNQIKNYVFDIILLNKLKKLDLEDNSIIHSWDFLPLSYNFLKNKNSKIKIYQDVPMALGYNSKGRDNKFSLNYIKKSIKYIDKFIVPSEFVKDSLIKEKVEKNKIEIIPFGVDSNKFKPLKNKQNKTFKVAFSGNVNNRKGMIYIIQAWKELNLKNSELNIYGRVYPEVRKLFTDSKKYNINVYGFVDLKKELNKNHIFLFPSLLEGSAKSVYEAMACGLPIISTFNAGTIIEDKKEGFIIPIQDVKAIKEKVLFFYNNRDEIEKFAKRARLKAQRYTWKRYGKEIIKHYK